MNFSEITSQINSLNDQISNIQNMGNCFYNEQTKEIIPVNEASGKDLSGFEYYDFLPENILNEINQFNKHFELLDIKTTDLRKEIENISIQKFCEQNPEWSNKRLFDQVINKGVIIDNFTHNSINKASFTLHKPILKIIDIESDFIYFKILDENNNEIFDLFYNYWSTTNKNLFNQIFQNTNSVGQIIKPEMVRVNMFFEKKQLHEKTLYKIDFLQSVKFWMNKPGRKSFD